MSTPTDYRPRPNSLPAKLLEFFSANPDEELTRADISQKFGVAATSIDNALKTPIEVGLLATRNDETLTRVWCAGPAMPPPSDFKRWLNRKGLKSAEGRAAAPALPPPDDLLARIKAAPLPSQKPRGSVYHTVWDRMAVGQCVELETAAAKRLISNAQAWGRANKRKFVMRTIGPEQAGIWRTE